uniref:Uncharacterized protein n=1 Tax=Micrurus corallinus TaxID=54390 RepID=A0A2D4GPQ0_MICCO
MHFPTYSRTDLMTYSFSLRALRTCIPSYEFKNRKKQHGKVAWFPNVSGGSWHWKNLWISASLTLKFVYTQLSQNASEIATVQQSTSGILSILNSSGNEFGLPAVAG